jgi:hypothetical protein
MPNRLRQNISKYLSRVIISGILDMLPQAPLLLPLRHDLELVGQTRRKVLSVHHGGCTWAKIWLLTCAIRHASFAYKHDSEHCQKFSPTP